MNCLTLGDALMMFVARRIARASVTNPQAAEADYKQAASSMTDDERAIFDQEIVRYAIMEG